jgi:YD repeat-containing protein
MLKQIYSIKRGNQRTIQTSIDGLRLIAERTGKYAPGKETTYTYDDKGKLLSATAYVKKMTADGTWHEIGVPVFLSEYNPGQGLWSKMPKAMLSKCSEACALRRSFPAEMCGIYSDEEMAQADVVVVPSEEKKEEPKKVEQVVYLNKEQIASVEDQLKDFVDRAWLNDVLAKSNVKSLSEFPQKWFPDLCKRFEQHCFKRASENV